MNGEPSVPFPATKGLRQGDPISPFLFAIVMEYLSRSLKGLQKEKEYKFHPRCSKLSITHLSFVDDLLLFARGDIPYGTQLQQCLNQFYRASGLQANQTKSFIYNGGVTQVVKDEMQQRFGYSRGELPVKYLEVSLSTKNMSLAQWQPLIEKIIARISFWTTKNCLMQVAAAKNHWDLAYKVDKLWIRWISSYYIKNQQLDDMPIPQQASWLMLGQLPRVEWKISIFTNEARAKAKFTILMYLQNKLLTSDRLLQWGIPVDTICVMCQLHNESRNHLFVECVFAQRTWNKVLMWLQKQPHGLNSWNQHWRWAMENAKGKSQADATFKMIYAEIIHMIWCERNNRVFEKAGRDVEEIARTIA
ncbi:uncharacterized protein LOC107825558 [Nicotiana tabacum]|uniref:Uncharacterized protein LOC107825558 n=1 Tax=Nicotiana tabacum TaxID=4097 RepID=A0A1S4D3R1_TOBAC|nr:PREDICTED: uncharacterized protein LOC107825558 [Nicotiana tabacum]